MSKRSFVAAALCLLAGCGGSGLTSNGHGGAGGSGGTGGAGGTGGGAPITSCPDQPTNNVACAGTFSCSYDSICRCGICCAPYYACRNGTFVSAGADDGCLNACRDGGAGGSGGAPADGGAAPDGSPAPDSGSDSGGAALPICASPDAAGASVPTLVPQGGPSGSGWGTGAQAYALSARTANGWTLALESGTAPAATSVIDDGNLLAGLAVGDRIEVNGVTTCQPFSGCKVYFVVKNAADGAFIAASYNHDSGLGSFASLLGVAVTLEPVCQAAQPDGCYPGTVDVTNQLRFGDDPARIAEGASGSITIGGTTVRVAASRLLTVLGPGVASTCTDAGSFWRGGQTFNLAR